MKKAVYNVMLITIIAKILGFGREILLSYFFGAGGISDAYLISQTIPGTIFQFVGTGLATSFIPVYMKVKMKDGNQRSDQFTNTILTVIILFSTVVIAVVWIFTEPIVYLFASGFSGQTLQYAILFTRIGILSLYFSAMIYVFTSYLQANGIFTVVAFIAVPNSIAIMAAIVLGAKMHIMALPIGSLLAVFIQLLILWPVMYKLKYRFRLDFYFRDEYVKDITKLMIPVIIGVSVNQINVLIDRTVVSNIAVGGISALTYANSLIMFVQGIFSQSISTVYYPTLTKLAEEGNKVDLKRRINEALESMSFILFPITAGCMILSYGIIKILYGRGAFNENAIVLTGTALTFYGLGIAGYGFRELLSRVFFAYHDTKTPMINAMIGMALNIILNLTLSRYIGIGGVALATSISCIVTAIMLYIHLKKKLGTIFTNTMWTEFGKMILATGIMGIAVWVIYQLLRVQLRSFIGVVAATLAGVIVYVLCAKVLKIEMYTKVMDTLKARVRK